MSASNMRVPPQPGQCHPVSWNHEQKSALPNIWYANKLVTTRANAPAATMKVCFRLFVAGLFTFLSVIICDGVHIILD